MDNTNKSPTELIIASIIFILFGVGALIETLVLIYQGIVEIDFGLLGIFVGWGLLKHKNGWRIVAMIVSLLFVIFFPFAVIFTIKHTGPFSINLFFIKFENVSKLMFYTFWGSLFVLHFCIYRILTSKKVENLFFNKRETV